jgi:hypothetical protein
MIKSSARASNGSRKSQAADHNPTSGPCEEVRLPISTSNGRLSISGQSRSSGANMYTALRRCRCSYQLPALLH